MLAVVCDHLATPKEMFDAKGKLVWAADYHVWRAVRSARIYGALAQVPKHGRPLDEQHCPWRFPGQYEDTETGLYYNRHRYYDPLTGQYASPDPIGLAGGDRPQGYVDNPNTYVDVNGLSASVLPNGPTVSSMASTRPNFYVSPTGETIQSTGYRYMRYLEDDGSINKYVSQTIAVKEAPGSYFGFEKFSTGSAARDAFQIKGPATGSSWSDARLRGEFDTLQLYDPLTGRFNTRVPFEAGDTSLNLTHAIIQSLDLVMCNSLKLIKCSSSIRLIFCRRNGHDKRRKY
ncbi:RHS repeat-associated core domain-containing protein [Agrobacterium rosae]|uniref:RHS repeat-associated core domain-containing protein n=1 Tax=Agrobacterium rosae TaxID=1972867 RepID=UPI003A801B39